jgi:hypothetical protein
MTPLISARATFPHPFSTDYTAGDRHPAYADLYFVLKLAGRPTIPHFHNVGEKASGSVSGECRVFQPDNPHQWPGGRLCSASHGICKCMCCTRLIVSWCIADADYANHESVNLYALSVPCGTVEMLRGADLPSC